MEGERKNFRLEKIEPQIFTNPVDGSPSRPHVPVEIKSDTRMDTHTHTNTHRGGVSSEHFHQ